VRVPAKNQGDGGKEFLRFGEAARFMNMSTDQMRYRVETGAIRGQRRGGQTVFALRELQRAKMQAEASAGGNGVVSVLVEQTVIRLLEEVMLTQGEIARVCWVSVARVRELAHAVIDRGARPGIVKLSPEMALEREAEEIERDVRERLKLLGARR
jgi:hypothetical protein